jgi:hypothetical protein
MASPENPAACPHRLLPTGILPRWRPYLLRVGPCLAATVGTAVRTTAAWIPVRRLAPPPPPPGGGGGGGGGGPPLRSALGTSKVASGAFGGLQESLGASKGLLGSL